MHNKEFKLTSKTKKFRNFSMSKELLISNVLSLQGILVQGQYSYPCISLIRKNNTTSNLVPLKSNYGLSLFLETMKSPKETTTSLGKTSSTKSLTWFPVEHWFGAATPSTPK